MTLESKLGFKFTVSGVVHESAVAVEAVQIESGDFLDFRNAVFNCAQSTVDLIAALIGASLTVELQTAQSAGGQYYIFDSYIPIIARPGSLPLVPAHIEYIFESDASQAALADFCLAMQHSIQTGFFCYRAIESIMQSFRPQLTISESIAWELMRESLGVSRDTINKIKVHADWARHGRSGTMSDNDRSFVLSTTQAIILRYLNFVANGRGVMPEAQETI